MPTSAPSPPGCLSYPHGPGPSKLTLTLCIVPKVSLLGSHARGSGSWVTWAKRALRAESALAWAQPPGNFLNPVGGVAEVLTMQGASLGWAGGPGGAQQGPQLVLTHVLMVLGLAGCWPGLWALTLLPGAGESAGCLRAARTMWPRPPPLPSTWPPPAFSLLRKDPPRWDMAGFCHSSLLQGGPLLVFTWHPPRLQ